MGGRPAFTPLPLFAGEEGPKPKAWEVRVCTVDSARPSPSHCFAAGPSLSRERRERGFRGLDA